MSGTATGLDAAVEALLRRYWHPVCTLEELAATPGGCGPLPVRLCGEDLVVVVLNDAEPPAVLQDRCLHRSTKLSIGWVDGTGEDAALQCAYHGWRWDSEGRCVGIPSLPQARPGAGLTARRVPTYESEVRYGLVWTRLESRWPTSIPDCPAFEDPTMRAVAGDPYTWPVSVIRRVENFTDLAHFAWVHDGSLGSRAFPEVPIPEIRRHLGALRFSYLPPGIPTGDPTALLGFSDYTLPLPCTVSIEFDVADAGRRALWMTTSPIDAGTCRTFWFTCRSDDLDGDDAPHLAFQDRVLAEDEPVVAAQDPPAVPWSGERELSVSTDAVSLAYRRWLAELAVTATPAEMATVMGLPSGPPDPSRVQSRPSPARNTADLASSG